MSKLLKKLAYNLGEKVAYAAQRPNDLHWIEMEKVYRSQFAQIRPVCPDADAEFRRGYEAERGREV